MATRYDIKRFDFFLFHLVVSFSSAYSGRKLDHWRFLLASLSCSQVDRGTSGRGRFGEQRR